MPKYTEERIQNARKAWNNLSEEQKDFFIDIWENNRNDAAKVILREKLGLPAMVVDNISKLLRDEGKIRNKMLKRLCQRDILKYKQEYECGKSLNAIIKDVNSN